MESLLHDVRYELRSLRSSPAFALVAVITLALGIGANTAIFSVVNAVLLRPLPYKDPDRLMVLRETKLPQFPEFSISPGNYLDWQRQNSAFERVAASRGYAYNLVGKGEPQRLRGARVTSNLFDTLGVQPALGRAFRQEEDQPEHGQVVILSHGLWQRLFGGEVSVLNSVLNLGGQMFTVIGVMPPGFQFPNDDVDLWTPMAFTPREQQSHGAHYLEAVARLKRGISTRQAQAEMSTIAGRLSRQFPDSNAGWDVRVVPMLEYMVRDVKPALIVLLGAVGLVLLIACANVANLQLARASVRGREITLRAALGAGRWRIVRQMLTESFMLSIVGAASGLLLAWTGLRALLALAPAGLPRLGDVRIDGFVVMFSSAIALLTGVLFGIVPALHASRTQLVDTLKEGGRGQGGGENTHRVRGFLVVAEVALALVLLVGAGLLLKSFYRLNEVDPGFKAKGAIAVSITLPPTKYSEDSKREKFFTELLQRLRNLPGVQAVGATHVLPFDDDYILGFAIQGRPPYQHGEEPNTNYYAVSPDYFRSMGIPLLRGRTFTEYDRKDAPRVALINETMARRYFPGEDPIGKKIHVTNGPVTFREIVGIVGDVKHYGLDSESPAQTYEPYTQQPATYMVIVIRYSGDPASLGGAVRAQVLAIDKEQPVESIRPLDEIVRTSVSRQRFAAVLLGIFACLALILAAVGIYGVMAYSVSQRTHEMGIRMALGAQQRDVLRLVIGQGMLTALVGLAVGIGASLALTRVMSSLLFKVQATDPMIFAGVTLLLAGIAFAACYVPARRAIRVDPIVALRYE